MLKSSTPWLPSRSLVLVQEAPLMHFHLAVPGLLLKSVRHGPLGFTAPSSPKQLQSQTGLVCFFKLAWTLWVPVVVSCLVSSKHKQWEVFTEFKLSSILVSHLKTEGGEDGRTYRRIWGFEMKKKMVFFFSKWTNEHIICVLSLVFHWLIFFSELGTSAKFHIFILDWNPSPAPAKQLLWKCTNTLHSKGFEHWLLSNLI